MVTQFNDRIISPSYDTSVINISTRECATEGLKTSSWTFVYGWDAFDANVVQHSYRNTICRLDVEDEILNEGNLVQGEDDLQAGGSHLGHRQEVQRDRVDLEMAPLVITYDLNEKRKTKLRLKLYPITYYTLLLTTMSQKPTRIFSVVRSMHFLPLYFLKSSKVFLL